MGQPWTTQVPLLLLFLGLVAVQAAVYTPGDGPVYVGTGDSSSGPKAGGGEPVFAVLPSQDVADNYYTTQTVYGFLDFTTTIGNTVMIFSPQSAAPAVTEPPKTTPPPPPVIETSPPPTTPRAVTMADIKPSKTVVLPVTPKEKVSIVQVLPETPKPPVVKPIAPLKFVPKAVPKVAIKPIGKPKPKAVPVMEVTPIKAQEPEKESQFIVKPAPKSVIIKPVAPVVKVVATKVEPSTTEKQIVIPEPEPEPVPASAEEVEESEEENEQEEQEQEQEDVMEEDEGDKTEQQHPEEAEERDESANEEEQREVEMEEEEEEEQVEQGEDVEHVETVVPVVAEKQIKAEAHPVTDKAEPQVPVKKVVAIPVESVKPAEKPEEVVNAEEHKEHSPIEFSNISEDEPKNEESTDDDGEEEDHEPEAEQDEPAPVLQIGNNIGEPEYDFLSRQPSEFVEETFRVVNLKPTATVGAQAPASREKAASKPKRGNKQAHPTGLVTKLGGTVIKDGATTVHETSVIGTYISGKYAQVLQSTSHVFQGNGNQQGPSQQQQKVKLSPSSTLRILKTAAPNPNKTPRYNPDAASIITPSPLAHGLEDTGLPLENLFASQPSSSLVRPSRRLATGGPNNFKNRLKNRITKEENELQDGHEEVSAVTPQPPQNGFGNGKKTNRYRNTQTVKPVAKNTRYNRYSTSSVELATVSVFSETATPAYANRRNKAPRNGFKSTSTHSPQGSTQKQQQQQQQQQLLQQQQQQQQLLEQQQEAARRSFKPKPQPSSPEQDGPHHTTSLYKFKLNRSPGRWQYKTPAKPTVTIRKQSVKPKDPVENLTTAPITDTSVQYNDISQSPEHSETVDTDADLAQSGSVHGNVLNDAESDNQIERRYPIETLKVEISTPADFKDTYYEIATIKSPYTFQVGTVKNTRYITVTSTFEKLLEQETTTITPSLTEPLTENILATTSHIDKESNLLDSSIATLPPIALAGDTETPPLETLTETFSTTQSMLKTHILPVVRDGDTTSYTLIQTYHVTRLVTATKTLPPMELYHFVPSKTLNEFNSRLDEAGSELHLELEFGDENENEDEDKPKRERLPSDLDLANIGSDFDLSEVDKASIPENIRPKKKVSVAKENRITTEAPVTTPALTQEQLQQLALLRLLNPAAAAQIPSVITSSKPVIKLETVFESHVLPIINGHNTIFSTISRPIGTITKTNYEIVTTTLPSLPIPQIPQLNPFAQQPQLPQVQIQSTPVVTQTVVTETNSKVLKLTFGAKTAYTTLYSTTVVPTVLTTYLTQSVPVQPTAAAFPGYFPAPYAPFPYVG